MSKNVQINQELFLQIVQYFYLNNTSNELRNDIKRGLEDKIDALMKHQLYSDYKTAENEHERELARQKYLEMQGIQESFRWSAEHDRNNRKS